MKDQEGETEREIGLPSISCVSFLLPFCSAWLITIDASNGSSLFYSHFRQTLSSSWGVGWGEVVLQRSADRLGERHVTHKNTQHKSRNIQPHRNISQPKTTQCLKTNNLMQSKSAKQQPKTTNHNTKTKSTIKHRTTKHHKTTTNHNSAHDTTYPTQGSTSPDHTHIPATTL